MASFTPILSNQPISYVLNKSSWRNPPRENVAGTPVFYTPPWIPYNQYGGTAGPYYLPNYNYYDVLNNPPSWAVMGDDYAKGNCTWWCTGRLLDIGYDYASDASLWMAADAVNWYDNYRNIGGSTSTDATNIQPGDIIVLGRGGTAGHVAFVEKVEGNTVYISQSAYSSRNVWNGMACLVTTYNKSDIYAGNGLNIYKDLDSAYIEYVVGVLHTGGETPGPGPDPPVPPEPINVPLLAAIVKRLSRNKKYSTIRFIRR